MQQIQMFNYSKIQKFIPISRSFKEANCHYNIIIKLLSCNFKLNNGLTQNDELADFEYINIIIPFIESRHNTLKYIIPGMFRVKYIK